MTTAATGRLPIVAIVGRPNVGKSALFNRMVGGRPAIVEDLPGTTRDRLYGDVEWRDREFKLVDTGGLEPDTPGTYTPLIREQIETALAEAEIVLFVVDAKSGATAADAEVADILRRANKPVFLLANKAENEERTEASISFFELGIGEPVPVSAQHGHGVAEVLDMIVDTLPPAEATADEDELRLAIIGRPNVGKSSLLNALVGEHLAIVSPKPQSTRRPVVGVLTRDETQIAFTDTPGLLEPEYALHEAMRNAALRALEDSEVIAYLHPLSEFPAPPLSAAAGLTRPPRAPVITVYTKADLVRPSARPAVAPSDVIVSATSGEGLETFIAALSARLPEGPFVYDPEAISTQPLRFFAAEFVREAAFEQLQDELPYSITVEIDEFRESAEPVYIRATVYVERASQKGIVIGEGGRAIKAIGTASRTKIEALVGARVFLDLHVKVLPRWRRDAPTLKRLGYLS